MKNLFAFQCGSEILRGVYPEPGREILRFAQNDRRRRAQNDMKSAIYDRAKYSTKLLSGRILSAHEEERKRLSRELHDGVGQSLLGIKLSLQMMDARAKAGIPIGREAFSELISEVSSAIDELRNVAMDLRPFFLEDMDMGDAFRWYGRKFQEKSGIQIHIHVEGAIETASWVKDHVYRIYQETLSNVLKHSGATCVEVRLRTREKMLSLEVGDNGQGFDHARAAEDGKGLGLLTLRERAELLGGAFRITSSRGRGTSIQVEVPAE